MLFVFLTSFGFLAGAFLAILMGDVDLELLSESELFDESEPDSLSATTIVSYHKRFKKKNKEY